MSKRAYKDSRRTIAVEAKHLKPADRNYIYYCLNPACSAKMHLCLFTADSNLNRFAAFPSHPHIPGCSESRYSTYVSALTPASWGSIDEFDQLVSAPPSSKSISGKASSSSSVSASSTSHINTLKKLYVYCSSKPVNDKIWGTEILKLLADSRSAYYYKKNVHHRHAVVATYKSYSDFYLTIHFLFNNNNNMPLRCKFSSYDQYMSAKNRIIKNHSPSTVCIWGNWKNEQLKNNVWRSHCTIDNESKQLYML